MFNGNPVMALEPRSLEYRHAKTCTILIVLIRQCLKRSKLSEEGAWPDVTDLIKTEDKFVDGRKHKAAACCYTGYPAIEEAEAEIGTKVWTPARAV